MTRTSVVAAEVAAAAALQYYLAQRLARLTVTAETDETSRDASAARIPAQRKA